MEVSWFWHTNTLISSNFTTQQVIKAYIIPELPLGIRQNAKHSKKWVNLSNNFLCWKPLKTARIAPNSCSHLTVTFCDTFAQLFGDQKNMAKN